MKSSTDKFYEQGHLSRSEDNQAQHFEVVCRNK